MRRRAEKGLPTPAWENRPELYEDLFEVWKAFHDLSAARTAGFGLNPISWDQMLAWFQVYGIEDIEVRDIYCQLIQAMDRVFMEHACEATDGTRSRTGTGS